MKQFVNMFDLIVDIIGIGMWGVMFIVISVKTVDWFMNGMIVFGTCGILLLGVLLFIARMVIGIWSDEVNNQVR